MGERTVKVGQVWRHALGKEYTVTRRDGDAITLLGGKVPWHASTIEDCAMSWTLVAEGAEATTTDVRNELLDRLQSRGVVAPPQPSVPWVAPTHESITAVVWPACRHLGIDVERVSCDGQWVVIRGNASVEERAALRAAIESKWPPSEYDNRNVRLSFESWDNPAARMDEELTKLRRAKRGWTR